MAFRVLFGFTKIEGIMWITIGAFLLGVEIKATHNDRAQQEKQLELLVQQNQRALEENARQFAETTKRMRTLSDLAATNINEVTGGDSFCFVQLYGATESKGHILARQSGDYQLHDVIAHVADLTGRPSWTVLAFPFPEDLKSYPGEKAYPIGNMAVNGFNRLGEYDLNPSGTQNLSISFTAMNGNWIQYMNLQRINGKWVEALRVYRQTFKPVKDINHKLVRQVIDKFIFKWADNEYPRVNGKMNLDWDPHCSSPQARYNGETCSAAD